MVRLTATNPEGIPGHIDCPDRSPCRRSELTWSLKLRQSRKQVMKDGIEAPATRQASEKSEEGFVSRKLIRPSLGSGTRAERPDRSDRVSNINKRTAPP